jgi:hypothetical protein
MSVQRLCCAASVGCAGVAVGPAQLLGLQHPLYAALAAVIVTDLAPS